MMFKKLFLIVACPLFFIGCASITGTTGQSISVETRDEASVIAGANCEMTNSKGKWFLSTPGSVQIRRSNDDLIVTCQKDGYPPGTASIVSETKGSMFGNILLGGGIGALVDHNSGAAYEYPTLVQIIMGRSSTIGNKPMQQATPTQSAPTQTSLNATTPSALPTQPVQTNSEKMSPVLAREKCTELGFQPATEQFGKCVIQLSK